jgi:hypothetical protein
MHRCLRCHIVIAVLIVVIVVHRRRHWRHRCCHLTTTIQPPDPPPAPAKHQRLTVISIAVTAQLIKKRLTLATSVYTYYSISVSFFLSNSLCWGVRTGNWLDRRHYQTHLKSDLNSCFSLCNSRKESSPLLPWCCCFSTFPPGPRTLERCLLPR